MPKIRWLILAAASLVSPSQAASIFANDLISYNPGIGFSPRFTHSESALGEPSRVNPFAEVTDPFNPPYGTNQIVSIGEGGWLVVRLHTPILNHPLNLHGLDFTIFGNAGFIITNDFDLTTENWIGTPATDGALFGQSSGTTWVSVSRDGTQFYRLNPALAPPVDNFPPTDGTGDFHIPLTPGLTAADFAGASLEDIRALYQGSGGGASYDISWAQDADDNPVFLPEIHFIRVDVLSGKAEIDGFATVARFPAATGGADDSQMPREDASPLPLRAWIVPGNGPGIVDCPGPWISGQNCEARRRETSNSRSFAATRRVPAVSAKSRGRRKRGRAILRAKTPGKWRIALFWLVAALSGRAASFQETFASDPLTRGWRTFGDASLFHWNALEHRLEVTWDSSRTNSFFHVPLGTVLTKSDDFSFFFKVRLSDIRVGSTSGKSNEFEIAVGLLSYASATNANAFRGAGQSATYGVRNVVEFDYFPDAGFGDTLATTVISTNNRIFPVHNFPLTLGTGDTFQINVAYTASNQLVRTTANRNGASFGLPPGNSLGDLSLIGAPDFRVDSFAVINYSDAVQAGPPAVYGSILAHGAIDEVQFVVPDPPVRDLRLRSIDSRWRAEFAGLTNWSYTLERSTNLSAWLPSAAAAGGNGTRVCLADTNPAGAFVFYRVRAERP